MSHWERVVFRNTMRNINKLYIPVPELNRSSGTSTSCYQLVCVLLIYQQHVRIQIVYLIFSSKCYLCLLLFIYSHQYNDYIVSTFIYAKTILHSGYMYASYHYIKIRHTILNVTLDL